MERQKYYEQNEEAKGERPLKSMADLVAARPPAKPVKGGVNSSFNNAVSFVVVFMGEEKKPKRFGYWCGRLYGLSPTAIFGLLSSAKEGNKPHALFEYLLKKEVEKRKKLSTPALDGTTPPGV